MNFTEPVSRIDERFELGTQQWLEAARLFLGTEIGARGLADVPFSVGSRWADTPEHIGFKGSVGGWSARSSGGRLNVTWGAPEVESLDLCVVGDYNAAIPVATTVYGNDALNAERADREGRHRAGDKHLQITGALPDHAAVGTLMHDLHDHLARYTIDNLDTAHRLHHLGLDQHVKELAENGFTILERAVTEALADEMANEIHRVHDEHPEASGFRANMLLKRGRLFEEGAQHPFVMALVEHLIGRGCLMFQSNCIRKGQGKETHQLHADYLSVPEPFPEYPLEVTSIWALEDWTLEAGPTLFVPGSFREKRRPRANDAPETVPLLMPKGSIALWDGATWHSASPRTREGQRVSLHNAYCRMELRPVEHYMDLDPAIVQRNPPRFSALCGLDDFYGRNTHTGPDFERMKAAMDAGYGTSGLSAAPGS